MESEEVVATDGEEIDLKDIPVKALNISSRMTLSWFLNPEQPLRSSKGIARDYRGLAEQMDFEYNDIKNFQRNENPTSKILEAWEARPGSSLDMLLTFLENMERHDVIQDTKAQFQNDAKAYLRRHMKLRENPIQVPEVTSCRPVELQFENPNALTVSDAQTGDCTFYDAYVCYAEEDTGFVWELAKYLESPEIGLKLFIKGRDMLLGACEPDSYVKLIEERCNRMLIILSPDFLKSPECEFQTSFAAGLAIDQRKRKLIPIILSPCDVPLILKYISKIDFTKPAIPDWLWNKLIMSIRGTTASMFVPPKGVFNPKQVRSVSPAETSSRPIITFPPTSSYPELPSSSTTTSCPVALPSTSVVQKAPMPLASQTSVAVTVKTTPPSKLKWFHHYRHLTQRFTSTNSNAAASSSSSATSGFHSQSSATFESRDDSSVSNITGETSM